MNDPTTIEDIKPCWHTRSCLSGLVDGQLTGLLRRYTLWHISHCPRCQAALAALTQLSLRLRGLGAAAPVAAPAAEASGLSSDRWKAMEAAWEESERTVQ